MEYQEIGIVRIHIVYIDKCDMHRARWTKIDENISNCHTFLFWCAVCNDNLQRDSFIKIFSEKVYRNLQTDLFHAFNQFVVITMCRENVLQPSLCTFIVWLNGGWGLVAAYRCVYTMFCHFCNKLLCHFHTRERTRKLNWGKNDLVAHGLSYTRHKVVFISCNRSLSQIIALARSTFFFPK